MFRFNQGFLISGVGLILFLMSFPLSARPFSKRFDRTMKGVTITASNILTTCDSADPLCDGAKHFTGPSYQNNPFMMVNVDADADPSTFNSSSSRLNIPAQSRVIFAGLYWGGLYGDNGDPLRFFPPPHPQTKNEVLLKAPNGAYKTVVGQVDVEGSSFYQGFADVTDLVSESGDYWVANAQLTTGNHMYGGWSLVVVVESELQPLRRVVVWDGFIKQTSGDTAINLLDTLGSRQEKSSVAVHMILYDGDKGNRDSVRVDGNLFFPKNTYPQTDPAPAGDIGNSTITNMGNRREDRNPFYKNTLGYDADFFEMFPYLNADKNLDLVFRTRGDVMHIGVLTVQSDVEERFVQTDWSQGRDTGVSTKIDSEDHFLNRSGNAFYGTVPGDIHGVQMAYLHDGLQYEISPQRRNDAAIPYMVAFLWGNQNLYPLAECNKSKYWMYREVDTGKISWMYGANGPNAAPDPLCQAKASARFNIHGAPVILASVQNGNYAPNGYDSLWETRQERGAHVMTFQNPEFQIDGIMTASSGNVEHQMFTSMDGFVAYDWANPKPWTIRSDFDGRIESLVFDAVIPRGFGELSLDYSSTNASSASVYFRSGDSEADVLGNPWEGPFVDGDILGSAASNEKRFFQYAVVTKLINPPLNGVESTVNVRELSFNFYGIASPLVNAEIGSWKKVEEKVEFAAPLDVVISVPEKETFSYSIEEIDEEYALSEADALEIDSACSSAGKGTFPWFGLLLVGLFIRRKKSK